MPTGGSIYQVNQAQRVRDLEAQILINPPQRPLLSQRARYLPRHKHRRNPNRRNNPKVLRPTSLTSLTQLNRTRDPWGNSQRRSISRRRRKALRLHRVRRFHNQPGTMSRQTNNKRIHSCKTFHLSSSKCLSNKYLSNRCRHSRYSQTSRALVLVDTDHSLNKTLGRQMALLTCRKIRRVWRNRNNSIKSHNTVLSSNHSPSNNNHSKLPSVSNNLRYNRNLQIPSASPP